MNYSMLRKTPSRYALEIEHIYQLLGTAAWWCDGLSTQKWIEIAGVQAISAALVILHWHWISQTSDAEMCVLLKYKIRIVVVENSYYQNWYFDKKSCFVGFFFKSEMSEKIHMISTNGVDKTKISISLRNFVANHFNQGWWKL